MLTSSSLLSGIAPQALAEIAGYKVIMVHGFKPQQLISPPTSEAEILQQGYDYWSEYWHQYGDAYLAWNSAERIEGNNAKRLFKQLVNINESGLCNKGCIMVTHSTGDLITRYLLDHQEDWFKASGKQPLKIVASLDFAGAGGGTELANTAISFAASDAWWQFPVKKAVELWLGDQLTPERMGILYDLQPSVARHISTNPNPTPRLRFIGGGNEYYGITEWFIPGWDDGVVPTHSACGAVVAAGYESCSTQQGLDGEIKSAGAPNRLWHNHYPILMGKETHHGGSVKFQRGVMLTLVDNFKSNTLNTDFANQRMTHEGWFWNTDYLYVPNSESHSMSELVIQHFNQTTAF